MAVELVYDMVVEKEEQAANVKADMMALKKDLLLVLKMAVLKAAL